MPFFILVNYVTKRIDEGNQREHRHPPLSKVISSSVRPIEGRICYHLS